MTLTDVKNSIFSFLLKNDVFIVDKHTELFKYEVEPEIVMLAVREGLKDFEAAGLVKKLSDNAYIVTQPLVMRTQGVEISAKLSEAIAEFINKYRVAHEIEGSIPDKLNITEEDLGNLLYISQDILINGEGSEEEDSDEV